jgi:hypothetical protein
MYVMLFTGYANKKKAQKILKKIAFPSQNLPGKTDVELSLVEQMNSTSNSSIVNTPQKRQAAPATAAAGSLENETPKRSRVRPTNISI